MRISQIRLTTFRNYAEQTIETGPDINVFYGDNAQGKTNILEAIYLCTCARSHRTARDADLIMCGASSYAVQIDYSNDNGTTGRIELRYLDADPADPQRVRPIRQVFHDGIRLERISDLMGLFHAVVFAPEDLLLVKEGPSARRRFLDLLISQIRPTYFVHLQKYDRFLQQRNRMLKNLRELPYSERRHLSQDISTQLDVWDHVLSKEAGYLIEQRQRYAERLAEIAGAAQLRISAGIETLNLRYRTVSGIKPDMDPAAIAARYATRLAESRLDDIDRGMTGSGPHRDDLELSLDGDSLKPFASQGQQRTAVLALKLAELEILRTDTEQTPVLLLDDVMSELDAGRRFSLLQSIGQAQIFITCTDVNQVARELSEKNTDIRTASDATKRDPSGEKRNEPSSEAPTERSGETRHHLPSVRDGARLDKQPESRGRTFCVHQVIAGTVSSEQVTF